MGKKNKKGGGGGDGQKPGPSQPNKGKQEGSQPKQSGSGKQPAAQAAQLPERMKKVSLTEEAQATPAQQQQPQPQGAWGKKTVEPPQQGGQPATPRQQQQGGQQGPPRQQQQQHGGQQGPPRHQQQGGQQVPPRQQQGPPMQQQGGQQGPPNQQQQGRQQGPPRHQQQGGQGPPQQPQSAGRVGDQRQVMGRGAPVGHQQQRVDIPQQAGGRGQPISGIGAQGDRPSSSQAIRSQSQPVRPQPQEPIESYEEPPGGSLEIPQRKNLEQSKRPGIRLEVLTNHLAMELKNYKMTAYHYDITLDPDKPKFLLTPAVNKFCRENFKNHKGPAFDGRKNLYSNGPLFPDGQIYSGEVSVFNPDSQREKVFKISMKFAKTADMSELEKYKKVSSGRPANALTVLDAAMSAFNRARLESELVLAGRGFFRPGGTVVDLGDGVEMWCGYFQSVTLGWDRPFLNVDVAHCGFVKSESILDIIQTTNELSPRDLDWADDKIKNLKIDYQLPGQPSTLRRYRVNGVEQSARRSTFTDDSSGIKYTVESYFRDVKKCPLKYPNAPTLWIGSKAKKLLIPSEFCRITPGQAVRGKYNESQTANMVRACAVPPRDRKAKIENAMRAVGFGNGNPFMEEFGITVAKDFTKLNARVLPAPSLQYANNKVVQPSRGQWNGEKFTKPAERTEKWAIMSFDKYGRPEDIIQSLCNEGEYMGLEFSPNPKIIKNVANKTPDIKSCFESLVKEEYTILFVILSDRLPDNYARVKTVAETQVGLLTQCLKTKTVRMLQDSRKASTTMRNILLKVNAKLGGTNHNLADVSRPRLFCRPFMVLGADVTHPAPGMGDTHPSVAAVSASYDPKAFRYNIVTRVQKKGERIVDMVEIMKEQLLFFHKANNGHKPQNIIMFRDGVSDGEVEKVMPYEISDMRRACKSLGDDYNPAITFIVVQKRHHTRFFPTNVDGKIVYDTRNGNVPAGTVVDTTIVHPFEIEYFLVSHASIQGTARPTKYRLVCDDAKFTDDELQQLTYYLCHLYTRCNRTVSYPAPTYYAHWAAFRVRHYLEINPIRDMSRLAQEQGTRTIRDDLKQKYPMLFV